MILDLSLLTYLMVAFVVILMGISKSGFAGALGGVSVPLLLLVMDAQLAVALLLPLLIIADFFALKNHWKQWDVSLLKHLFPGAVIGIIAAHNMFYWFDESMLRVMVAMLCLLFGIRGMLNLSMANQQVNSRKRGWFFSVFAGISSTLVHAGGPPLMMYLSTLKLMPKTFVATASVVFAGMNFMKVGGFIGLGILTPNIVITALCFTPLALLGSRLGLYLQNLLTPAQFTEVINIVLLILGLLLLLR